MCRRILSALLAFGLLESFACAEVCTGVTVARTETAIYAESEGVLQSVFAQTGSMIETGAVIAQYRTEKVFAAQDGTVAEIHCSEGDTCTGTVLEVLPVEKYRIYCTAENAYKSPESMLVHAGERLFVKCTVNGTHRGVGTVTEMNGNEFNVLTVGGEFHAGETVYLYRDEDFSSESRVGIGTAVENDTEKYDCTGKIASFHVEKGEEVERGELLYEYFPGTSETVRADAGGIVTAVSVAAGQKVQPGQHIATVAQVKDICVEMTLSETALDEFPAGTRVGMTFTADRTETIRCGTVAAVSAVQEDGLYTVTVTPDEPEELKLGMTAQVFSQWE